MASPLNRRRFVSTAAAGLVSSALSGCATTAPRLNPAVPVCLPPVQVGRERLIRNIVGLRPYRASGFVVRMDALGDGHVVHNYGHGGAGITLSWGTSRLAVDIGTPGYSGPVAVIGAGVVGLTTARLLQERGFPVTVYAAALPPETTSNAAGGQWNPAGHFRPDAVTPEWSRQYLAAAEYSWRRFQLMVGEEYGVRWLPTFAERRSPEQMLLPTFPPASRLLSSNDHPFPVESLVRYQTLYVEPARLLGQLMRDIQTAGARIEVRQFTSDAELGHLPEQLVFNCTGLGSRALFGDHELRPARGQLAVLLPQPEVQYAFSGNAGYMFPRSDGIILGGTFELDNWSIEPDEATTQSIIASHEKLFGNFRC